MEASPLVPTAVRIRTIGFCLGWDLFSSREEKTAVVPRSEQFCEIMSAIALKVHRRKAIIDEELRSFGCMGPCLFDLRQRVGSRAKYYDGNRRRPGGSCPRRPAWQLRRRCDLTTLGQRVHPRQQLRPRPQDGSHHRFDERFRRQWHDRFFRRRRSRHQRPDESAERHVHRRRTITFTSPIPTTRSFAKVIGPPAVISTVAGNIYTVAQTSTNMIFGGDGGPATAANLHFPDGCAFDSNGNMYIADRGNNEIRVVLRRWHQARRHCPQSRSADRQYLYVRGCHGRRHRQRLRQQAVMPRMERLPSRRALYGPFDVSVDASHPTTSIIADLGNNFDPNGTRPHTTGPMNNNVIREILGADGTIIRVAGTQGSFDGSGTTTSRAVGPRRSMSLRVYRSMPPATSTSRTR